MSLALLSECYLQNFKKLKKRNKKTIQKTNKKTMPPKFFQRKQYIFNWILQIFHRFFWDTP